MIVSRLIYLNRALPLGSTHDLASTLASPCTQPAQIEGVNDEITDANSSVTPMHHQTRSRLNSAFTPDP
jgi:hypothetical protein